jgi:hypothetical protein
MAETIDLKFTLDDLKIIDAALAEMPYRIAAPLISSINFQLNSQEKQDD